MFRVRSVSDASLLHHGSKAVKCSMNYAVFGTLPTTKFWTFAHMGHFYFFGEQKL